MLKRTLSVHYTPSKEITIKEDREFCNPSQGDIVCFFFLISTKCGRNKRARIRRARNYPLINTSK